MSKFFVVAGRGERGDPGIIRRGKKEKKNNFLALSGEGEKKIMNLATRVRGGWLNVPIFVFYFKK
jgi:hypothetical protein